MKFKATRRAIMDGYVNVIEVGYCSMQHLLHYKNPIAYTCGQYGWNADVYDFGNTAIVTGYRPFGNIKPDYAVIKAWEDAAERIVYDREQDYEVKKIRLDAMTKCPLEELVQNKK